MGQRCLSESASYLHLLDVLVYTRYSLEEAKELSLIYVLNSLGHGLCCISVFRRDHCKFFHKLPQTSTEELLCELFLGESKKEKVFGVLWLEAMGEPHRLS